MNEKDVGMNTLLRVRDVLAIVGVARSTWWLWCSEGRAPQPIRIGSRCTRWRKADIERWLADPAGWQGCGE